MGTKSEGGFTLVEVMIVVVIVAILAAIAIPSYQSSVYKGRRADAKESLFSAAALQEQIYMQKNAYSDSAADVGGSQSGEGYYGIAVTRPCGDDSCFLITASARGAQSGDTDCSTFSINQAGTKIAKSAGGSVTTGSCW